jgi:hypothetical protein
MRLLSAFSFPLSAFRPNTPLKPGVHETLPAGEEFCHAPERILLLTFSFFREAGAVMLKPPRKNESESELCEESPALLLV